MLGTPTVEIYNAVKAWMELRKRHPMRQRFGEEGRMARKWYHLRSLDPSLLFPSVRDGLDELKSRLLTDPAWLEAEAAEKAAEKVQRSHSSHVNAYRRVAAWVETHGRQPDETLDYDESAIARVWRNLLTTYRKSLLPDLGHLVDCLLYTSPSPRD